MNLANITPLVLTYNEAPNIEACLESLRWASEIVVVDSHSSDDTALVVTRNANTRLIQRRFDSHAAQWNHGLRESGIRTEWVLAMDADYRVTPELLDELRAWGWTWLLASPIPLGRIAAPAHECRIFQTRTPTPAVRINVVERKIIPRKRLIAALTSPADSHVPKQPPLLGGESTL